MKTYSIAKHLLAATIAVCLFPACDKDDDEKSVNALLALKVSDDYFKSSGPHFIFLSDSVGNVLTVEAIENNIELTLGTSILGVEHFTTTLVGTNNNGLTSLRSWIGVRAGAGLVLDSLPAFRNDTAFATGVAKLEIAGVGQPGGSPFHISGSRLQGFGHAPSSLGWSVDLFTDYPTSVFAIYRNMDDNQVRYVYEPELWPGTTTVVEQSSLPIIPATIIDAPNMPIDLFLILGDPIGDDSILLNVSDVSNFGGPTPHYLPDGVFENYLTYAITNLPSNYQLSVLTRDATVPNAIVFPDFDFVVNTVSNGFEATTTAADFDVLYTHLKDTSAQVEWTFTAEQVPDFSFQFPAIPILVTDAYPALLQPLNMEAVFSRGDKFEDSMTYQAYLDLQFQNVFYFYKYWASVLKKA